MSRGNSKISRDTSFSTFAIEEPSWANDYLAAVEKYSIKSKKEDTALFDQINQILGNSKSKFSSVEEVVLDMQKRIGLTDFLQKQAADGKDMFAEFPDLKDFIKAKVDLFPGSAINAIGEMILQEPKYKNFIPAGEHIPDNVEEYINSVKKDFHPKDENNTVDGKMDLDLDTHTVKENNPLNGLNPASF